MMRTPYIFSGRRTNTLYRDRQYLETWTEMVDNSQEVSRPANLSPTHRMFHGAGQPGSTQQVSCQAGFAGGPQPELTHDVQGRERVKK